MKPPLVEVCALLTVGIPILGILLDQRWLHLLYLLCIDTELVLMMISNSSINDPLNSTTTLSHPDSIRSIYTKHDDPFIPRTELEHNLFNLIDHDTAPRHSVSSYLASQTLEDLPISVQRNEIMEMDAKDLNESVFYHFFARESQPLLIKNADAFLGMDAYSKWKSDEYFRETMGSQRITVYSDDRESNTFAPFDENMKVLHHLTMSQFLDLYKSEDRERNYYFAEREIPNVLIQDLRNSINGMVIPPWTEFMQFGMKNVKIWFGHNSTNSLPHTDPYENLLFIFDGEKRVKLVDPTRRKYVYAVSNYSPIDFFDPNLDRFPMFEEAYPLTVTVEKGSVLYIPALWWHHVMSSGRCVAVSEWFTIHSQLYSDVAHCLEKNLCV